MSISLVAASIAAAAIHFALGPEHVDDLGLLGAGFYLAGLLQLGWAGLAILASRARPGDDVRTGAARFLVPAGIGINVAILAAWLVSRVVGLPAGAHPWTPEAIGISDAITAVLEGGLLIGLLRASRPRPTTESTTAADRRPASDYPALVGAIPTLALILVAAVTAVATPHAHAGATHGAGGTDAGIEASEAQPHTH